MAISKTQSLFFLLFLLFSLKTQARAVRESHFFNKATRDDPNFTEPQTLLDKQEDQIPTPKQEEPTSTTTTTTTTPTYQQSQNGYGLYANGYNTPSTSTEEYNTNDLPSKYSTEEYTQPKTYNKNNKKNSYPTTQLEEKPGMSDTRYMENGRYYYDINSEKNQDKYESTRYNTNLGYKSNSYSSNNNNNYMGYKSNSYSSRSSNNNNNNMGYYEPSKRVDSVSRYDNNNNYGSGSYYRSNNENGYEFDGESVNRFRNRQETDNQEDDFEP